MARPNPYKEEECLNVYWKITNFSYALENIRSSEFILSGYKWCLQIQPKVIECKMVCLIPFGKIYRDAEISFLTCDGSKEAKSGKATLRISNDSIFGKRRSAFLPKGTLTIRCRNRVDSTERGRISIQSRVEVKRSSIIWTLINFSSKRYDGKYTIENSDQFGEIQLNLKCAGGINCDEQFYIEISRRSGEKCYCVLKVSVLDVDRKASNFVGDEFVFEKENREQFWKLPPIIKNSKLLAFKNQLLPKDTLSLKCDFEITLGKAINETFFYSTYKDMQLRKNSDDLSMCSKEESLSTDLKTDLKSILDNETLCDVSLQVGSEVIQAHKNILSARSPVFKAMLTKDMKETLRRTVIIEDLDSGTVRNLLLYMYTDAMHDYKWENVKNVYFAADKYGVLSLKQKCSYFLKENLSLPNVCKTLILTDLHQDADLLSGVLDFLSEYESEVFASEEWKELERNHSALACQTLRKICAKKRLD